MVQAEERSDKKWAAYHPMLLGGAAVVGLWLGVFQPLLPQRSAISEPADPYHLIHVSTLLNHPVFLAVLAAAILIGQVRRGFQGWAGILAVWLASGMVGSVMHHLLRK